MSWVNNELFLIKDSEVPTVPIEFSHEAREWWMEQKLRCIEGYTVGGKWMSPNIYFYVNFWRIALSKTKNSKSKSMGRPWLRDIEWEIGTAWSLARGLSGFDNIPIPQDISTEDKMEFLWNIPSADHGSPLYNNEATDLMLMGPRDFGKFLLNSEPLLYKDGEKPIGNVKIGDKIYGRDGKLTNVTGVYPQGKKDIYEFKLLDGRISKCGLEHLWGVYQNNKYKVLSTKEIIASGLKYKHKRSGNTYKYYIPEIEPVRFPKRDLPVDPYILGALIGDGKYSSTLQLSCDDPDILKYFKYKLPKYEFVLDKDKNSVNKNISYHITYRGKDKYTTKKYKNSNFGVNPLYREIKNLGLNITAHHKFIPDIYKYSSTEQRMELLRGLMDTDGSINTEGSIEFTSCSKRLAEDVLYVARSLGIKGQLGINDRIGESQLMPQGTIRIIDKLYYRVFLRTDLSIFRLSRKLNRLKKRKRTSRVAISEITLIGNDEATCITVDNTDHLFLTKDFIPTHNTEFVSGGVIAHEFLFSGAKKYYPPGTNTDKTVAEITVGAGATSYTNTLFAKFRYGYDAMAQMGVEFGGKVYPHPFIQKYDGALTSGKTIVAQYRKKVGSEYRWFGSKSKIRHVAYGDGPYAAQGTRNSVMIKEEIGEFDNLVECQENDLETMRNGSQKSGSCLYLGTGGNMGSGTLGAYKMFYAPETYNLLPFNDKWENKGKIGMFIPGTKRYQDFKDTQGRTNEEIAHKFLIDQRETLKKKKNSKQALLKHIQYNPLVPSEIFLRSVGNIFPVQDLATVLAQLETGKHFQWNVDLLLDERGKVYYQPNKDLEPIMDFPLKDKKQEDGCVVLYEPVPYDTPEEIPFERYISSLDPYNQNKAEDSPSLGSFFILDTWNHKIVSEYTGRPQTDKVYYENVRRLLKLYNCRVLHENMFISTYNFFEYRNETHLLLPTPSYLKEIIPNSKVERGYGTHMREEIRFHLERQLLEWLITTTGNPDEPDRQNLHNIRSIPLLKELILYDGGDTNTDRADSMLILMLYLRQITKNRTDIYKENYVPIHKTNFFTQPLFKQGQSIFR